MTKDQFYNARRLAHRKLKAQLDMAHRAIGNMERDFAHADQHTVAKAAKHARAIQSELLGMATAGAALAELDYIIPGDI